MDSLCRWVGLVDPEISVNNLVPMKILIKSVLSQFGVEIIRYQPRSPERHVVSLRPQGASKGNVLLSYDVEPFLLEENDPVLNSHTGYWDCKQMTRTFLNLGYCVDVIHYNNDHFVPAKKYFLFTGLGRNFDRISELCNAECIKVLHIVWAHWSAHNTYQYERLLALKKRKGVMLKPRRLQTPTLAIEYADYAIVKGNEYSRSTYSYAKKPIFPIPSSINTLYAWPDGKNFDACRDRFLWFGGEGVLHKGLDLVLEAFRELSDYHLTVCGPKGKELDFERIYHKELFETPNINYVGWVDVSSPEFVKIVNSCIAVVYASCSESGGASVIVCMHAGLIPVTNYESSAETADFGVVLKDCSINTIKDAVRTVSSLPKEELELRARKAWEYARANHTRKKFATEYKNTIEKIIALESHNGAN